jgi:hypothetical protein
VTGVNWDVDTVEKGKIGTLSAEQVVAFENGFKYTEGTKDVFSKLSKLNITVTIAEGEITFKKGSKILGVVGSRISAGRLIRYAGQVGLTAGTKAVGVVFIMSAGGKAMAAGGDFEDVATAVARETVMADVVEGGVKLIVVDGAGNYTRSKLYGENYLNRYKNGTIGKIDEKNIKHYGSEHPFLRFFGGSQ